MLREMFNRGQFFEMRNRGELSEFIHHSRHPETPASRDPYCTMSEVGRYETREGEVVALFHQYRRPDGRLGASGRPDPLWVKVEGQIYWAKHLPRSGGNPDR